MIFIVRREEGNMAKITKAVLNRNYFYCSAGGTET
jgi:hypothetical protein